ncbi:four-helix bundle copper-binding protein [Deminuibacter soli]|uniref:Four-helix bundle copper-binding protein n=1 Tax=Deminuibacter soli TaxID=2291815 RepID=A0A3E1NJI6_9BACT|nr:four-helix bundle copper-binding protein [Deminuibacter soli]RFM28041.1 four-helix bundle copper-binding protein [Deminuibacter soli]
MINSKTHVEALVGCITACTDCAGICVNEGKMLDGCMRLSMQCISICQSLIQFIATGSSFVKQLSALCAEVCMACAKECSRHDEPGCRQCMNACMDCATVNNSFAASVL